MLKIIINLIIHHALDNRCKPADLALPSNLTEEGGSLPAKFDILDGISSGTAIGVKDSNVEVSDHRVAFLDRWSMEKSAKNLMYLDVYDDVAFSVAHIVGLCGTVKHRNQLL